jgi:arginase family enzyme
MTELHFLGVPFNSDGTPPEAEHPPRHLRNAALMPVIFPAGAGLTLDQTATVLDTLLKTGRVIGMDVACFHPNLDHSGTATTALIDLLTKVLAK